MINPPYWAAAVVHLRENDPVMADFITTYSPVCGLKSRGDAFETLARSIVGQQISVKAAASVWQRVQEAFSITPSSVAAAEPEALRSCGLSRQKVKYLIGIATAFAEQTIHPASWTDWSDEQILAELITLPGVGSWTAEMFLMFHLLRPDVLPLGDAGIIAAFERFYRQPKANLATHAECWRPYRTVACWYLWRALDNAPTNY